jgi:hypothetical protein
VLLFDVASVQVNSLNFERVHPATYVLAVAGILTRHSFALCSVVGHSFTNHGFAENLEN